jgi:hypothetical protein
MQAQNLSAHATAQQLNNIHPNQLNPLPNPAPAATTFWVNVRFRYKSIDSFHSCSIPTCLIQSPCIPFAQMIMDQLRYHVYWKTSKSIHYVGQIIRAPILAMKQCLDGVPIKTPLGDFSGKAYYSVVTGPGEQDMGVAVLESNGKSGLLYKTNEEKEQSFGLVKEGSPYLCLPKNQNQCVELTPGLGLLQFPSNSSYQPTIGANLNPSRIIRVPYNSRVEDFGRLPSEIKD